MTGQELINELTRHGSLSDEIEISGLVVLKTKSPIYNEDDEEIGTLELEHKHSAKLEIEQVRHNNGARRRILIVANEAQ